VPNGQAEVLAVGGDVLVGTTLYMAPNDFYAWAAGHWIARGRSSA
jgi:hypothetical protein